MARRILLVLCILALSGASACDRGPTRLSRSELTERADAACAAANRSIADLPAVDPADPDDAAAGMEAATRIQRALRAELDELVPPADDEAAYEGWLDEIDAGLGATAEIAEALRAGDAPGIVAAGATAVEAASDADEAGDALGLDMCVTAPPAASERS